MRVCHLPTFVSIEPANYCQLRCPECPVGHRAANNATHKAQNMNWETYERILSQVKATAHTMQFYFQGEPLLNPLLPEMIAHARKAGLFTIVSTNAQALTPTMAHQLVESGLNRIIVSIDGFSEESYAAYRVGGSLHQALEGLQYLRQAKSTHHSSICIELQVLRLRSNEHEWEWIRHHYRSLGATRLVFKTAQFYDFHHGNPLMPTDERYSRYHKAADGTYHLHRSTRFSLLRRVKGLACLRLWSGCVITTAGDVLPCCYDKEHHYSLGNIHALSLTDIFHSAQANVLRQQVLNSTPHLPAMCQNCDN